MTTDDTTEAEKKAALSLLRRGLVTQAEAARLAGVTRQVMSYWAADLDCKTAREQHLAKLWKRAVRR